MKIRTIPGFVAPSLAVLLAAFAMSGQANAVSVAQAKAQCHEQFVPIVKACVRKSVCRRRCVIASTAP
jgi:hypothetical protein